MCLRLYFIVRRDVDFVLFRLWEHCSSVRDDGADACFRQVQIQRDFFWFRSDLSEQSFSLGHTFRFGHSEERAPEPPRPFSG